VIPEPLGGLLWHCAATLNSCSIQEASTRSSIAKILYGRSPAQPFLVHEITLDYHFILQDKTNMSHLKLSPVGELIDLKNNRDALGSPAILSGKQISRLHNTFLQETTKTLSQLDLNLNEKVMTGIYSADNIAQLNCFEWELLEMLIRILNLEFALINGLQAVTLSAIHSDKFIYQLKSSLDFHNRNIKKEILNALIFNAVKSEKMGI
jgi:hypothetical protein